MGYLQYHANRHPSNQRYVLMRNLHYYCRSVGSSEEHAWFGEVVGLGGTWWTMLHFCLSLTLCSLVVVSRSLSGLHYLDVLRRSVGCPSFLGRVFTAGASCSSSLICGKLAIADTLVAGQFSDPKCSTNTCLHSWVLKLNADKRTYLGDENVQKWLYCLF